MENEQHDDAISKCLVDLHGTCLKLPFHRQGLPYLSLLLVALFQIWCILKRMIAREINAPNPPTGISEWHLILGRFGLLFFTVQTALDHFRLFLGSFDASWPEFILAAPNATAATKEWAHYAYRGTTLQTFLWWYCCFLQVLVPVSLYAVTYIYYKARLRLRLPIVFNTSMWFLTTTAVVVVLFLYSLVAFFVGPAKAPLKVIQVTGLWSLTTTSRASLLVSVVVWLVSLIALAVALLIIEGPAKRRANLVFIMINTLALASLIPHDDSWWSAVAKLLQQLAIGSHIWADVTHNPDDYGRLNDDTYLPLSSLRQPLLAAAQQEDDNVEQDDVEQRHEDDGERQDSEEEGDEEESDDGIQTT